MKVITGNKVIRLSSQRGRGRGEGDFTLSEVRERFNLPATFALDTASRKRLHVDCAISQTIKNGGTAR
jgi:hypothetical protein